MNAVFFFFSEIDYIRGESCICVMVAMVMIECKCQFMYVKPVLGF